MRWARRHDADDSRFGVVWMREDALLYSIWRAFNMYRAVAQGLRQTYHRSALTASWNAMAGKRL
jgi:hypothetical protein